ncbi:hypothetical protein DRM22_22675 [Salmonella enterica subsp. enterica serovar Glostrup]|nr:hypothetical protein [Salmonella enterica subsp. enterica serovar Glostrup]
MVEPSGVDLTGLTDTGASCDAPARPTIEVQPNARHKKSADAPCVVSEVFSGGQARHLILQVRVNDTAISSLRQGHFFEVRSQK